MERHIIVYEPDIRNLEKYRRSWYTGWGVGALAVVGGMVMADRAVTYMGSARELQRAQAVIERLQKENGQLESELDLQERMRVEKEKTYLEAQALGITSEVERTGLPAEHQRRISEAIVREARKNELDPRLVVAVIKTESSFNSWATSEVGAKGLMQVMPVTGKWLAERRDVELPRSEALYDFEINIELGTAYLAELIKRFRSVEHALVAYNAGPEAAKKILSDPDRRTRFLAGYPKKVMKTYWKLSDAGDSKWLAKN
jgi:soluble lytic murein transglycosylase